MQTRKHALSKGELVAEFDRGVGQHYVKIRRPDGKTETLRIKTKRRKLI